MSINIEKIINEEISDFSPLGTLNEGVDVQGVIEKLKNSLNIQEWDSAASVDTRKKIATDLGTLYKKVVSILESTVSDPEKAKGIRILITGSMYASIIFGIWNITSFDFSDALSWGKIAGFLYILKFVHGVLVKGRNFKENIKDIWNSVTSLFKTKDLNESIDCY